MSNEEKQKRAMKPDPAGQAIRKAYRESAQARLDGLYRKRSLYRRRMTIAVTMLDDINGEIEALLLRLSYDRLPFPVPEEESKQ